MIGHFLKTRILGNHGIKKKEMFRHQCDLFLCHYHYLSADAPPCPFDPREQGEKMIVLTDFW